MSHNSHSYIGTGQIKARTISRKTRGHDSKEIYRLGVTGEWKKQPKK